MIDKDVKHDAFTESAAKAWAWARAHGSGLGWAATAVVFAAALLSILRSTRAVRQERGWTELQWLTIRNMQGAKDVGRAYEEWFQDYAGTTAEPWARLERAGALLREGKTGPARDEFRRLLEAHPDHAAAPFARLGIGWCLEAEDDLAGAERELRAVASAPGDPAAAWLAGEGLKRIGQRRGAKTDRGTPPSAAPPAKAP